MTKTRPTLLVVDDSVTNINILIEALGKDYTVCVDTDGAAALKSAKETLPDLILLDIMMPGMDGFEVCRQLKGDPSTRDIPIIFLTALDEDEDEASGLALGASDYITKPFNPAILKARVNNHLELRHQKRDLQKSYDKLRELEIQRDNLVHMVVHDMRSPLAVILGNLEMAQAASLPERVAACIGDALSCTNAIMEMVSTLLDINKMEAGQIILNYSAVDISNLVRETISMVAPLQDSRRITLTPPGEIEALSGDANLIRRILQNLIANAIKFTDKNKGIITLRIEGVADNKIRVSVVDNGPGIPPEFQAKVFDKFCQVAARKQSQGRSTGIGLTFCKLAVEAHGGRIGLESDEGKGSTFWFELPRRWAEFD